MTVIIIVLIYIIMELRHSYVCMYVSMYIRDQVQNAASPNLA